ncbi:NAD(P)H-binding protein [Spirosoma sp. KUDC1026]|uniref:NAD(P)H-binding protein n=1 Tax=Spirosoma sp. KUDC1026 TaxID=2745947 RepID=UPI00159BAEFB|nr:NAD(P)H-binding protein [Spirosoma sp. KUDC1026]QKZ11469.1 NAD(P)H-binding protein [Spirosoma sp. KUDC1026]
MSKGRVSIIGCGWLGTPLAERLVSEQYLVKGSTTTESKMAILEEKGIEPYLLQFDPAPIGDLDKLLEADSIVILLPPRAGKMGEDFYPQEIKLLTQAMQKSSVKQVILVSSTSIYPENNQVAVEDDVQTPGQSAAPALVDGEQAVLAIQPDRNVTVVRFGGLLGYDRIPGKYVAGRTVNTGAVPVNYIHRDDAVGILMAILSEKVTGVFNAVVPEHPSRKAVYLKNCADFGFESPTFVEPETPVLYKIISAEKLDRAINYSFKYPNPLGFFYQLTE